MASKHRYPTGNKNFGGVRAALVNSKLQVENNSAYQTHRESIEILSQVNDEVGEKRNKSDKIDLKTEVKEALPPIFGGSRFGTYFPETLPGLNVSLISNRETQFLRAGRLIYITGVVFITPTAGLTLTTIELSLPTPSNFTTSEQVNGTLAAESLIGSAINAGLVTGNVTLGTANLRFYSVDATEHDVRFTFSYEMV